MLSSNQNPEETVTLNETDGKIPGKQQKGKLLHDDLCTLLDKRERESHALSAGIGFYKLFWFFAVGSVFGTVIEMVWGLLVSGKLDLRVSMVYGPFNLIYGIGAVALIIALHPLRHKSFFRLFFFGMLAGSFVEYLFSYLQEVLFHTRSWDYSDFFLNIHGRICLFYSVMWGFLGVVFTWWIYPVVSLILLKIPRKVFRTVTWALFVFMCFDGVVTVLSLLRYAARAKGIAATSALAGFLDRHFPDARMEFLFYNIKVV